MSSKLCFLLTTTVQILNLASSSLSSGLPQLENIPTTTVAAEKVTILGNWTVEDLRNYRKNVTLSHLASTNCTTFFDIQETSKYLTVCTNLQSQRSRRSLIQDRFPRDVIMKGGKEFLPSGLRVRVNNPWRVLELKTIQDSPCIGSCMLEKMRLISPVNRELIIQKVIDVLVITTRSTSLQKDALEILELCGQQYEKRLERIKSKSGDKDPQTLAELRCKAATRFGICLSRESYAKCRDLFLDYAAAATATNSKRGH